MSVNIISNSSHGGTVRTYGSLARRARRNINFEISVPLYSPCLRERYFLLKNRECRRLFNSGFNAFNEIPGRYGL